MYSGIRWVIAHQPSPGIFSSRNSSRKSNKNLSRNFSKDVLETNPQNILKSWRSIKKILDRFFWKLFQRFLQYLDPCRSLNRASSRDLSRNFPEILLAKPPEISPVFPSETPLVLPSRFSQNFAEEPFQKILKNSSKISRALKT